MLGCCNRSDGTPKSLGPSASAAGCGSNTSLSTLSGKKKKPAPPPPTSDGESPFSSLTSSPSHSVVSTYYSKQDF